MSEFVFGMVTRMFMYDIFMNSDMYQDCELGPRMPLYIDIFRYSTIDVFIGSSFQNLKNRRCSGRHFPIFDFS